MKYGLFSFRLCVFLQMEVLELVYKGCEGDNIGFLKTFVKELNSTPVVFDIVPILAGTITNLISSPGHKDTH